MRAQRKLKSAHGLVLLAHILVLTTALVVSVLTPLRVATAQTLTQTFCSEEDLAFMWPLEDFSFGVFGLHETRSYGDKSWDLFAKNGLHATVVSPINGVVTEKWVDSGDNTAIKIENTCRYVWMLHGNWDNVTKGDSVKIGQVVGTQDNHGQSWGPGGVECNDREGCAEHVHLDVFDKIKGTWVDPRTWDESQISPTQVDRSLPEKIVVALPESPREGWGSLVYWFTHAWVWIVLVMATIFIVIATLNNIKLRTAVTIVGLGFLLYAWILPSQSTWLSSPITGVEIKTHYGDVRVDPNGTTGTTWEVVPGTPIKAIASGIVINNPSALESFFGWQQIWVDTGNGLYIQYALPEGSTKSVYPGSRVTAGEQVGIAAGGELRLGVSSKHPDKFVAVDDRSYGWIDPEQYLGKSTLSGSRKNEAIFMQLGLILLICAWFWPKVARDEWPFPWDFKTARYMNFQLILGLVLVSLGITMDGPFFKWVGTPSFVIGLVYFIGRIRYRRRESWRISGISYVGTSLGIIANVCFLLNMTVAAAINHDLLFVRRAYALNLPNTVTPSPLPEWLREYVEAGGDPTPWNTTAPRTNNRPEEFQWTYWNGSQMRFTVPQEVWDAAVAAYERNGSCEPELLISVAWSENPHYTNVCNSIGACGDYQFMPGTWDNYWPNPKWEDPSVTPSRLDREAIADAACRKFNTMGLSTAPDKATFRLRFTRQPLAESIWNAHDGQANSVWDTWQELKRRQALEIPTAPTLPQDAGDWMRIEQGQGASLYQAGNSYLAVADLSLGAQVVLTGGSNFASIDGHWNELGSNAFFISNGTFYESSGLTTFPFVKDGIEVTGGAKTESYQNARYLVIGNNIAAVVAYSEWTAGTGAPYLTAGLPPSAETSSNYWTLIAVSADGSTVYILQLHGTPQQGVDILSSLFGIPESHIILFDGGGSTQGKYANGYTRNTGRAIPQGIGIIAP